MTEQVFINFQIEDLETKFKKWFAESFPVKEELEFLTIQEASDFLKVTKPTIYDYQRKGLFSFYKIQNRTLIKKSEIIEALEKVN